MKNQILKNISLIALVTVSFSAFPISCFAEEVNKIPTTLETPKLPDIGFIKPENMPDINVDLTSEYQTIIKDLEGKGFGKVTLNLKDEGLNTDWSNKGSEGKLTSEEFSKYLTNIESKYAQQINDAKKDSSGISYKKLDLKGKWELMSLDDAKKQSIKLPNYNELKNNLQSSVSKPSTNKQPVSYTPPKEFSAIKDKVMSGNKLPNLGSFSNLPDGLSINVDGSFTDNRTLQSIPSILGGTVGNVISDAPNLFSGFVDGFTKGSLGGSKTSGKYDSIINRQKYIEEEINKIH